MIFHLFKLSIFYDLDPKGLLQISRDEDGRKWAKIKTQKTTKILIKHTFSWLYSSKPDSSGCFWYPAKGDVPRHLSFHQIKPANTRPTTTKVTMTATAMAHPLGPCWFSSLDGGDGSVG